MLAGKRGRFARISNSIGRAFSKTGISPNGFTLLTLLSAFAVFYFLVIEDFLVAAALILITGFLDAVDGSVARYMKKTTKKGAYLDTIADRYVELIIIFALLFVSFPIFYLPAAAWIFLYLFGSLMTTYSKAAAAEKRLTKNVGGLVERGERFIMLFIGVVLAVYDKTLLLYVIIIMAALTNMTALQRIINALR
jgi:archaetidylinositol phosphate synthase